jgi:hypothetical protein
MNNTRAPRDRRPSLRLLVAASRLRDGQDPEQVAHLTRVPLALVTLLADELRAREHGSDQGPPPR